MIGRSTRDLAVVSYFHEFIGFDNIIAPVAATETPIAAKQEQGLPLKIGTKISSRFGR